MYVGYTYTYVCVYVAYVCMYLSLDDFCLVFSRFSINRPSRRQTADRSRHDKNTPIGSIIQSREKFTISQQCSLTAPQLRCGAHLCFQGLEPAVSKHSVLWTLDHTSYITCGCFPLFTLVLILPTLEGWPGWVSLGGWLNTERVRTRFELVNVTHPSTNRARRRITTLIETNAHRYTKPPP